MQSEVMFAGFGGQGVMLMGQILAEAAMQEGLRGGLDPLLRPGDAGRDRLLHRGDQRPARSGRRSSATPSTWSP